MLWVSKSRKLWRFRSCSAWIRWSMSLPAQFIDGCGRPCDHAETLFCVQFLGKVETCPLLRRQVFGCVVLGQGCLHARCVQTVLGSRRAENCGVSTVAVSTRWLMSLLSGARRCRRCSSCGRERPCNHAETLLSHTLEGASDSVHRAVLRTFQLCNRDGYACSFSTSGGYGGDEGVFRRFFTHFFALLRRS